MNGALPFHQKESPGRDEDDERPNGFPHEERFDPAFPFIAWNHSKSSFSFPLHWHERIEICYILKGSVRALLNGKTWDAAEGDIIIVNAAMIHGYQDPSPGAQVRIYQFAPEIFGEHSIKSKGAVVRDLFYTPRPVISRMAEGDFHTRLEALLQDMFREYQKRYAGRELAVKARLYEFVVIFLREMVENASWREEQVNVNRRLEQVVSWIRRNLDDPDITLDQAAKEAALSRFYFSRTFREQTGENFHAWLSKLRVARAKELLSGQDESITDIAWKCGFSSLATFNRIFKTCTGASPSAWRAGRISAKN